MSEDTEFAYFAGRREGTRAERERIIKALDEYCSENHAVTCFCDIAGLIQDESEIDSKPTETEHTCQCQSKP